MSSWPLIPYRLSMRGKNKMGVAKTLAEFGEHSSVHGISYITSSSSNHVDRLFWGCLVCLGLSVATYLSIEAFRDWNERPVITTLKDTSRQVQTMEFPSVTICTEGVDMEAVKDALLRILECVRQKMILDIVQKI